MLGNESSAEFIRDWSLLMSKHYRPERAPQGWTRVGRGCYRVAYLNESEGTVYKVEHSYGGFGQTNEGEYLKLRSMMLTRLPAGIRFPRYELHRLDGRTVAAMEYVPRLLADFSNFEPDGNIYWSLKNVLCRTFPDLWDMHAKNVGVDVNTKEIVPIDLGS